MGALCVMIKVANTWDWAMLCLFISCHLAILVTLYVGPISTCSLGKKRMKQREVRQFAQGGTACTLLKFQSTQPVSGVWANHSVCHTDSQEEKECQILSAQNCAYLW